MRELVDRQGTAIALTGDNSQCDSQLVGGELTRPEARLVNKPENVDKQPAEYMSEAFDALFRQLSHSRIISFCGWQVATLFKSPSRPAASCRPTPSPRPARA